MNVGNILANNPSKKFVKVGEGAHGNVYKACRRGACIWRSTTSEYDIMRRLRSPRDANKFLRTKGLREV